MSHDRDVLLWATVPAFDLLSRTERRPEGLSRMAARLRSLAAVCVRRHAAWTVQACSVLFVANTENQRRTLHPIAHRLAPNAQQIEGVRPRLVRYRTLACVGRELAHELSHCDHQLLRASNRPSVERVLLVAARSVARSESLIKRHRPKAVVVATQHDPAIRSLLATARSHGISTIYFPHAPAASNRQYSDLPTDYVGLRGPAERTLYTSLGADPRGIVVTGNGTIHSTSAPVGRGGISPVLAVSPISAQKLSILFDLIIRADVGDIIVASHPRSDRRLLQKLCPSNWDLWEGERTYDLLKQGPPCLVQRSSGVALEGLSLGIPTIELSLGGTPPQYPFIREPEVMFVDDSASLKSAISAAQCCGAADRAALQGWAAEWASPVGDEAVERCVDLIEAAIADDAPPKEPVLDGWSRVVRRLAAEGGR